MQDLQTIKILVVDYRAIVGSGVSIILKEYSDFEVVGQAKNGEEAVRLIERSSPDIVSMDVELPDSATGLELIRNLRTRFPHLRIVVLTNLLDDKVIRDVLQQDVVGYLLKKSSAEELVHAIRIAYQGLPALSPEVTQILIHEVTTPHGYQLTSRERQVLGLLVRGWNNHEIAKELNISLSTVQFHVSNILEKLSVHNRLEAATFAVRHNLATYPKALTNTDHSSATSSNGR